jgi:hypothetical protein
MQAHSGSSREAVQTQKIDMYSWTIMRFAEIMWCKVIVKERRGADTKQRRDGVYYMV